MLREENLWHVTGGAAPDAPALDRDASCDLAIVGGGFTGCAAALRAAEQGASVVLCEAEHVGHGGSGRNVGLVNAGLWLPPETLAETMGAAPAARLTEALGAAPARVFELIQRHGIACEATRSGTLHCAHAPSGMRDLRERHRQMAALGAPVTLLDADETRLRVGSDAVHGGLHDARAGTVQPMAYVRGLAWAAMKNGAQLHEKTPVSGAEYENGMWRLTANGHTIRARGLLVATNGYHRGIAGMYVPYTSGVHFFQLTTAPLSEAQGHHILPGREGCWDTGLIMSSWRRDAAGRLILGGMGRPEGAGRALHMGWARRKLGKLFPELAELPFESHWTGRIAMTRDHVPKVLRIGRQAYAMFGYSGRGIAPGTVMGEALADAILSGDPEALPLAPVESYHETATGLRSAWYETGARVWHGTRT
ncbi:NAD(P)/FAD-dependent oxidoreductase [Salipiger mucosus]|uniref:L-pipecolate oxidase n=1 Tax=Salipiger mucosus DSM 16094 TaxID=1123237 RepID=S9RW06_9RHOB|nr:FAD-binding oxidoreductase [Salipiger mucosus]EPX78169.1 L-pipecolate oxidase [Salipiger mucosus DSM 16094]